MSTLQQLKREYGVVDCFDLGSTQLKKLRDGLKNVTPTGMPILSCCENSGRLLLKMTNCMVTIILLC